MVTFNKSLTYYIEYIYGQIDEEEQYHLFDAGDKNKQVKITNIDKLLYHFFLMYGKENKKKLTFARAEQESAILKDCICTLRKKFSDVNILNIRLAECRLAPAQGNSGFHRAGFPHHKPYVK